MKNQLSARSPFWQITYMLHFFAFWIAYTLANHTSDGSSHVVLFPAYTGLILFSFACFTSWGIITARKYNRSRCDNKVSVWQITPPELIVDDERSRSISANASRAVYLYHNMIWPIIAIVIALLQSVPIALCLIGLALLGHYLVYWYNIRQLLAEE